MPRYQPVHMPSGSLYVGSTLAALGDLYGSNSPSVPSGLWNSLEPPINTSPLGESFSVRMRVCSSPAAANGSNSTLIPGTDCLNAATKALLVDSFKAEYTEMVPPAARAVPSRQLRLPTRDAPTLPAVKRKKCRLLHMFSDVVCTWRSSGTTRPHAGNRMLMLSRS